MCALFVGFRKQNEMKKKNTKYKYNFRKEHQTSIYTLTKLKFTTQHLS